MLKNIPLFLLVVLTASYYFPRIHRFPKSNNFAIVRSSKFDENDVLNFQYDSVNEEDELLYKQFMQQITEMSIGSQTDNIPFPSRKKISRKGINNKKVVETPTFLSEGQPIELVYKKKLIFGNFIEYNEGSSHSLSVRLQSDEIINVDVSQIISVWDVLADDSPPLCKEDWAVVTNEAIELLGKMSPRKSDLGKVNDSVPHITDMFVP